MEPEKRLDIIKKAIRLLNRKKGASFKLFKYTFSYGIDSKYGSGQFITITVQNTINKKVMSLQYHESFFDANLPNEKDVESGVDRISKPEDKVLLRVAYSIWFCRH